MLDRGAIRATACAAMLVMASSGAVAFDETKYPDWSGQWMRPPGIGFQWDQTRPPGLAQRAPLTPEYQAVLEASLADQAAGGQGGDNLVTCRAASTPTDAVGPPKSSRPSRAIRSASGSTPPAPAASTRSKSRPAT